ncbi:MAG TPA: endolytic transglycosylase MltG, partial [Anaerolineales bacterium]
SGLTRRHRPAAILPRRQPSKMKPRNSCLPWALLLVILILLGLMAAAIFTPQAARQSFGEPSASLNAWQRFSYGFELVWNAGDLTQPRDLAGTGQLFVIQPGESVVSISDRLEGSGLIRSASTFRAYLLWSGLDTVIQTGTYRLSPAQTGFAIAQMLKSTTLTEVTFTVLPGWRMEEIAAALPTSGLEFTPEVFLAAASAPAIPPDFIPNGASAEGFLSPDTYILPRTTTAEQLVSILIQGFSSRLPSETVVAYASRGLTLYQAVTLASIVQRESVVEEEMPLIASVFYNRLAIGMKLETDPTVQYALGYNSTQGTWWTNPLSGNDLRFDSPYNTYLHPGLPPGPISNPGLAALRAVANPAQTNYYFFQAKCDGSGLHNFAETFEQHQQNYCP